MGVAPVIRVDGSNPIPLDAELVPRVGFSPEGDIGGQPVAGQGPSAEKILKKALLEKYLLTREISRVKVKVQQKRKR